MGRDPQYRSTGLVWGSTAVKLSRKKRRALVRVRKKVENPVQPRQRDPGRGQMKTEEKMPEKRRSQQNGRKKRKKMMGEKRVGGGTEGGESNMTTTMKKGRIVARNILQRNITATGVARKIGEMISKITRNAATREEEAAGTRDPTEMMATSTAVARDTRRTATTRTRGRETGREKVKARESLLTIGLKKKGLPNKRQMRSR